MGAMNPGAMGFPGMGMMPGFAAMPMMPNQQKTNGKKDGKDDKDESNSTKPLT